MKMESERNYRWYDKFPCEKAYSREGAVCYERERCKWVNNGVYVCHPLEPFEAASSKPIPERAVSTQENLHRSEGPSENLVKTIRQIDGC